MEQHIPIGLLYRMRNQLVPYDSPIDVKVLQICLRAGKGRQTDPAPKSQASRSTSLKLNSQRMRDRTPEKPVAAFRIHCGLPVTDRWLFDYDSQ